MSGKSPSRAVLDYVDRLWRVGVAVLSARPSTRECVESVARVLGFRRVGIEVEIRSEAPKNVDLDDVAVAVRFIDLLRTCLDNAHDLDDFSISAEMVVTDPIAMVFRVLWRSGVEEEIVILVSPKE